MIASISRASRERILDRTCIKRPGRPQDVVRAVRFMTSEADYVTGQVIAIDGGLGL
jgi:pteridine reductase